MQEKLKKETADLCDWEGWIKGTRNLSKLKVRKETKGTKEL